MINRITTYTCKCIYNIVNSLVYIEYSVHSIFMMSMGFLTFGGNCAGFVLNNYASNDVLASFARLAIIYVYKFSIYVCIYNSIV